MKPTSEWKPAFNATLAHHVLEAYGLKQIAFTHGDDEGPVHITFVNNHEDNRILTLHESHARINDGRGVNLGAEQGSDWVQALVNLISHHYPASLLQ